VTLGISALSSTIELSGTQILIGAGFLNLTIIKYIEGITPNNKNKQERNKQSTMKKTLVSEIH